MDLSNDSSLPQRKKQRLKEYDYSAGGVYFITFNVADKDIRLSRITGKVDETSDTLKTILTKYGKHLETVITEINNSYQFITVSHYVLMPNHVHLIIELTEENKLSVSRIVGLMKRKCTAEFGKSIWQKSFYDHVITDDEDYYYHCQYIQDNPKKWIMGKDKYYA